MEVSVERVLSKQAGTRGPGSFVTTMVEFLVSGPSGLGHTVLLAKKQSYEAIVHFSYLLHGWLIIYKLVFLALPEKSVSYLASFNKPFSA